MNTRSSITGFLQGSAALSFAADWRVLESGPSPFGLPSAPLRSSEPVPGQQLILLSRHGEPRRIAPAAINYRSNIRALMDAGVHRIVALHTVGGIDVDLAPGCLVLPHQLIDYTSGRLDSFSAPDAVVHPEFTHPFDHRLREQLLAAAENAAITLHGNGVYGCTQGPRLETAAEIVRLRRDGCTLVGMTCMPEAILARELNLPYVSLCLVVNPAAGVTDEPLDLESMVKIADTGVEQVERLLLQLLYLLEQGN